MSPEIFGCFNGPKYILADNITYQGRVHHGLVVNSDGKGFFWGNGEMTD